MRRRDFITAIAGSAAAWPLAARAQQADRIRRIAVLMGYAADDPETKPRLAAFRQMLEKRGWPEGRNVHIETRFAPGSNYEPLAKELIATQPDVILAHTTPVAAALRANREIPGVSVSVPTPLGRVSSRLWHGPAAILPACSITRLASSASGFLC